MASHTEQARESFATIYLTLTGIIIALAVEKLIDRVQGLEGLLQLNALAALTWLQAGVIFVVAILMFVLAAYIVVGFELDFRLQDAATPFLVLVLISVAIALVGRGAEPAFYFVAALGQGTGYMFFKKTLRLARRYQENEALLRHADFRGTNALTLASAIIPLGAAVLLSSGLVGVSGALASTALMLVCLVALAIVFAEEWWRSFELARQEEGGAHLAPPSL